MRGGDLYIPKSPTAFPKKITQPNSAMGSLTGQNVNFLMNNLEKQ